MKTSSASIGPGAGTATSCRRAEARSRRRACCRPRSATGAVGTTASLTRAAPRSRRRPRPAPRGVVACTSSSVNSPRASRSIRSVSDAASTMGTPRNLVIGGSFSRKPSIRMARSIGERSTSRRGSDAPIMPPRAVARRSAPRRPGRCRDENTPAQSPTDRITPARHSGVGQLRRRSVMRWSTASHEARR